jgi:hypothetical protein
MTSCIYSAKCPFFKAEVGFSPALWQAMREQYCFGDAEQCARYIARTALGLENVPDSLMPSDKEACEALLRDVTPRDEDK